MKKALLTLLFITALAWNAAAQLSYVSGSFHSTNESDVATSGTDLGKKNMSAALTTYAPTRNDSEILSGIVRVSFKNVANEDIENHVKASANPSHINNIEYRKNNQHATEAWIHLDPGEDITLDITVDGIGSVRISGLKVASKHMYALEVQSAETLAVTFGSNIDGTVIYLDGQLLEGRTGTGGQYVKKEKTTMGSHHVKAQVNGRTREMDIEVAKGHTHFDIDMKKKHTVDFRSNEPGVELWEGNSILGVMPLTMEVDEGPHSYSVRKTGYDDVTHNINISTDGPRQLDIHKSKAIDFYALSNNTDYRGADVFINNERRGTTPLQLTLPYGRYNVRMSAYGRDKSARLTVDDNTASRFMLKLPARHRRFNPFDIDFHKREFGLTGGYVQKWLHLSDGVNSVGLNYFGEEKHMHGFQVGVPIQPIFGYGLGLNIGLYFEGYFADWTEPDYYETISMTELCLYMPVDLLFRLPLGEEFSIFINGGIGIDWSLGITCSQEGYDDWEIDYGEDGSPNRFNFSAEFGGGIQFKALQVSGNYQIGLNNNSKIVDDGITAKIRKFSVQLSLMF